MGGRKCSLGSPADFARVLKSQRRQQGLWLAASAVQGNSDRARLGLVVAKRWAKRAVDRNTIKRILREAFRQECAGLGPVDVVIRLRQAWPPDARAGLAAEARSLLKGLGR